MSRNPSAVSMARQRPAVAERDRAGDLSLRIGHCWLARIFRSRSGVPGRKGPHFDLRIGESLDEVEREFIFKTLDFTNGNKVRAAQILGISLKTLYNRLVRYRGKDRDTAAESRHHSN